MNGMGVYIWTFNVIERILRELYIHFGECMIIAVLCMFSIQLFEKNGVKNTITETARRMRHDNKFRMYFWASLYMAFLLSMTILGRQRQENPLVNVIGDWNIKNLDNVENLMLFLPYGFFFLKIMEYRNKKNGRKACVRNAVLTAFLLSSTIELVQFVFSVGTFQLSDIAMNTIGATVGASLKKVSEWKRNRKNEKKTRGSYTT